MVWYGAVRRGVVRWCVVWCGVVRCGAVRRDAVETGEKTGGVGRAEAAAQVRRCRGGEEEEAGKGIWRERKSGGRAGRGERRR